MPILSITRRFQENARFIMSLRQLNQIKLAEKSGLSKSQLNRVLTSESAPTLNTIQIIADALEVPPYFLLLEPIEEWAETLVDEGADLDRFETIQDALLKYLEAQALIRVMESSDAKDAERIRKRAELESQSANDTD